MSEALGLAERFVTAAERIATALESIAAFDKARLYIETKPNGDAPKPPPAPDEDPNDTQRQVAEMAAKIQRADKKSAS